MVFRKPVLVAVSGDGYRRLLGSSLFAGCQELGDIRCRYAVEYASILLGGGNQLQEIRYERALIHKGSDIAAWSREAQCFAEYC